jgi:hypothetical protein
MHLETKGPPVFDASDILGDPWKHYNPNKPPHLNDLSLLDQFHGFWILMKNDAVLIPGHSDPTTDPFFLGDTPIGLEPGWNFIGYPSLVTRPISNALAGVPYDMVQYYDELTSQWLYYDGSAGSLTQMEMGKGYWIHCTAPHLWQVDFV